MQYLSYKISSALKCRTIRLLTRDFACAAALTRTERKMCGWQIHSYGGLEELQYAESLKIPMIRSSQEILVKVDAAGVNPIDVAMLGGYGARLINVLRCKFNDIEFPLTLGREFSGVITRKGLGAKPDLKVGDEVWGVLPIQCNGSHAEYVVATDTCVAKRPSSISSVEAGGLLYAGLTAWAGIFIVGQLSGIQGMFDPYPGCGRGKRILVLGGAGGVGSAAIQILKAESATVIASCSTDAIPLVASLGVDHVIDYTNQEQIYELSSCGPYDIILDCAGQGPQCAEKFNWSFKTYVTFSAPLLRNVDKYGFGIGMVKNVMDAIESNIKVLTSKGGTIKWAFFVPSERGIAYLTKLVERKKFLPIIDSTFNFSEVPQAYKKVMDGHLRGKVVIDINSKDE